MKWVKLLGVALIAVIAISGLAASIWYHQDRTGMLAALRRAGLPNLSRPSSVEPKRLGCAILGARRRVTGVLLTGFEASNLVESDLPPPPEGGGFTGNTWFTCNQAAGCDDEIDGQLEARIAGLCDIGLARIVVDGWATETSGRYGHLGVYGREFYADEVVEVGPPPTEIVEEMRRRWADAGLSDCG